MPGASPASPPRLELPLHERCRRAARLDQIGERAVGDRLHQHVAERGRVDRPDPDRQSGQGRSAAPARGCAAASARLPSRRPARGPSVAATRSRSSARPGKLGRQLLPRRRHLRERLRPPGAEVGLHLHRVRLHGRPQPRQRGREGRPARDRMPASANDVNGGCEPRRQPHGRTLLRSGDEKRPVQGPPQLPKKFAGLLLDKPIQGLRRGRAATAQQGAGATAELTPAPTHRPARHAPR